MGHKSTKTLEFVYPLKVKAVRNLKIVTETVAELTVTGRAYLDRTQEDPLDRYAVDIDFVIYQGTNIKPVLEALDQMDEIIEAASRHASEMFEERRAV